MLSILLLKMPLLTDLRNEGGEVEVELLGKRGIKSLDSAVLVDATSRILVNRLTTLILVHEKDPSVVVVVAGGEAVAGEQEVAVGVGVGVVVQVGAILQNDLVNQDECRLVESSLAIYFAFVSRIRGIKVVHKIH